MKIALISDLHLHVSDSDFMKALIWDLNHDKPDVILNAGDMATVGGKNTFAHGWHKKLSDAAPQYYYVPGNHDWYENEDSPGSDLANDVWSVDLDDSTVLVFCTLWTNHLDNAVCAEYSQRYLADYRYIKGWRVYDSELCHSFQKNRLFHLVEKNSDKNVIVMTHHAPSLKCIHPRFKGDILNGAFVNDLDDRIKEYKNISHWCHGHVHDTVDALVGKTRIIANPRGYRGEANYFNFKPLYFEV